MRFLLLSLLFFTPHYCFADWYSDSREMMGTRVEIELWSDDEVLARRTIEHALAAMQQVDWMMNPLNPDSELYRVNQRAYTAPVSVPEALFEVMQRALRKNPLLQGKLVFEMVIEASGAITELELLSSELDHSLTQKMLARIRMIRFEADDVMTTRVNYSFDFLPY